MNGDNTLTDAEHATWQHAAGAANNALGKIAPVSTEPRHLFYIEATDRRDSSDNTKRKFFVTAHGLTADRAAELAKASVEGFLPSNWFTFTSIHVCMCIEHVWQELHTAQELIQPA